MSLYDRSPDKPTLPKAPKIELPDLKIAGLIVGVALIAWLGLTFLNPQPLTAAFEKNPISPGNETILKVVFKNLTGEDLSSVEVRVQPVDTQKAVFVTNTFTIDSIARDQERIINFTLTTSEDMTPGTYAIQVTASSVQMDEESIRATLKIK